MQIKLVTGATSYEAGVNVIKQIDVNDFEMENLVVVPDSFSMQAESLIFDVLNLKSTFNIEVVGISRLASKILRNNNIPFKRISGLEEVFIIYKVVKECEKNFKYFKKGSVDFCLKILQIIKQFKACKINPDQIKNVGDTNLDFKMMDLKMIYSRYEELLGEKCDLSKLLDFFISNAGCSFDLSKTNLYFVNFDSFSVEINDFICKLGKFVNKIYIGMAKPLSISNAYIYEDDIFEKTVKLAKEYGITVQVENFPTNLKDERLHIIENLFAFEIKQHKSDYFYNVVAKNKVDEIEFVAKYIKHKIFNGARYKDFSVAVSNKNYYDMIKTIFTQYGISLYCDEAVDLSQTILGRFLIKLLDISKIGFNQESLQYIVSSFLVENSQKDEILKDISYYNYQDDKEFIAKYPFFENLFAKIKEMKTFNLASLFTKNLKEIILIVENGYNNLLDLLYDEKYYKKESENRQAKELISKVLDRLTELADKQEVEITDFENLLLMAFKTVKVETIPSYVDAVYVGDATESYFEDVDTLFVLGASSNALPKSKSDIGIIDDEDIRKLKINFALEPEIKVLNKRNRLKLFELLQHGKSKLFVCTPITEENKIVQKANFVFDLLEIFGNNIIHTSSIEDINLEILSQQESLNKLLFYIGTEENLPNAYSKLKSKEKLPFIFESSLKNVINTEFILKDKINFGENESLKKFILKKNISASLLETYFACPFKFFVRYCLDIKQFENIEPNKRHFGIFEHCLLRKFVEEFGEEVGNVDINPMNEFLNKNVIEIAKDVFDHKILERKHYINFLKKESKIILSNLIKEQKLSAFRPYLLEKKIYKEIDGEKSLVGFVDRIDICGNYFRIIDYKTGKTENIKKELFYGKKLQLFLYAKAIKEELGLHCAGVYYFDCQTKYSKTNQNTTLLNGITLKNDEVVLLTDKTLIDEDKRSVLIGMSKKKNSKEGEFSFKNGNTVESFDDMFDYVYEISKNAIKEIEEGFIDFKPLKDECSICPYISVCRHREVDGYRAMKTLKNEDFKRNN